MSGREPQPPGYQNQPRVVADIERRKQTPKHGDDCVRESLDDIEAPGKREELLVLDEALTKRAVQEAVKARLCGVEVFVWPHGRKR